MYILCLSGFLYNVPFLVLDVLAKIQKKKIVRKLLDGLLEELNNFIHGNDCETQIIYLLSEDVANIAQFVSENDKLELLLLINFVIFRINSLQKYKGEF